MTSQYDVSLLGDLCDVLDSKRKPITKKDREPGPFPYYGATGILDHVAGYLFDEPLVLVGEDGAKWGSGTRTAFAVEGKVWVNNHAHVLRPKRTRLLDQWLIHYLNFTDLGGFVSGLTVPKLNQASLREIPVPTPPAQEQQRIVGILDEAFAGIATAKANAEKSLHNARATFDGHLQSVFSQRGDGWSDVALAEIADFRNGINFTKSSRGEKIRILGVKDFKSNYWAPESGLDHVTVDGSAAERDCLQGNDLVFVRSNGNPDLIGRCLLIGELSERTTHSGFTIRARLNSNAVLPTYVCHFLKSSVVRKEMIEGGNGANIKSLNQGTLAQLSIPYPSTAEQRLIVDRLEEVQGEARLLQTIYQRKLAALDELKQSLLHQAFSGQL